MWLPIHIRIKVTCVSKKGSMHPYNYQVIFNVTSMNGVLEQVPGGHFTVTVTSCPFSIPMINIIRSHEHFIFIMRITTLERSILSQSPGYEALLERPGPRPNIRTIFPGMGISIIKIRRSWDRLIFIMGIPMLVKRHLYTETVPRAIL